MTTRLEGCYSCRPCGDPSAQKGVLGRDEVGSGQVKICKCMVSTPNHIPEELSAQAKVGVPQKGQGYPRRTVAYQSLSLFIPLDCLQPRLGTSCTLAPDETAHGWVYSSLADRRAR